MPLAGLRRIDLPARAAWAPRYCGQRHHYETWDLAVSLAEGDLWLSHNVVSDSRGRALSSVSAIWQGASESGPMVLRTSGADPHLGLAPAYDAGFDSAGQREIFSVNSSRNPVAGRPGLGELGARLAPHIGEALFGETFAAGAVTSRTERIEWDLKWDLAHEAEVLVPAGVGPMGQVAYQVAGRSPSPQITGVFAVNGNKFSIDGSPGEVTHAWGSQVPKMYATAVCGRWNSNDLASDLIGGGQPSYAASPGYAASPSHAASPGHATDTSHTGQITLGLLWVKGGAWGRLGPPAPKTFGWIRVGGELMAFNALPGALAASSHVAWPRWESRLVGRDVKADIRIEADFELLTQLEGRDPECRRVWMAFTSAAELEVAFEQRAGRAWIPAGSVRSRSCRLDFGGRSPEQRVAVID